MTLIVKKTLTFLRTNQTLSALVPWCTSPRVPFASTMTGVQDNRRNPENRVTSRRRTPEGLGAFHLKNRAIYYFTTPRSFCAHIYRSMNHLPETCLETQDRQLPFQFIQRVMSSAQGRRRLTLYAGPEVQHFCVTGGWICGVTHSTLHVYMKIF